MGNIIKTLIGNIKGPKGDKGDQGIQGIQGIKGDTGTRGTRWTTGNKITGTNTENTVFPESDLSDSIVNDHYMNVDTGNIYRCMVAGDADTASWVWVGNMVTVDIPTDKTLTYELVPADAAAVGTRFTELNNKVDEATAIAKGKNRAHVFATTEAMQEWLSTESNKGLYNVGDNLYIVDVGVPDWWISEVLTIADASTGYYYKIAQLGTQKVDLTEIESNIQALNTAVPYNIVIDDTAKTINFIDR